MTISLVLNRWLLRVSVTAVALLTFAQAVLAGSFLAGHYDTLALHRTNSTVAVAATALMLVTAVLHWRPGRGPFWPVLISLLYFAVIALQTFLGYRRLLAYHVPLGTALIAAAILLLVWVWRPIRRPHDIAEHFRTPAHTEAGAR
jgi:heme A synthase